MKATLDVTPEQVYSKYPDIPSGYEVVKFSLPKKGELFIAKAYNDCSEYISLATTDHALSLYNFRVIVRKVGLTADEIANAQYNVKLKDVYVAKVIIPCGYYAVAFRPPTRGDVYLGVYGAIEYADHSASGPRLILKKSS